MFILDYLMLSSTDIEFFFNTYCTYSFFQFNVDWLSSYFYYGDITFIYSATSVYNYYKPVYWLWRLPLYIDYYSFLVQTDWNNSYIKFYFDILFIKQQIYIVNYIFQFFLYSLILLNKFLIWSNCKIYVSFLFPIWFYFRSLWIFFVAWRVVMYIFFYCLILYVFFKYIIWFKVVFFKFDIYLKNFRKFWKRIVLRLKLNSLNVPYYQFIKKSFRFVHYMIFLIYHVIHMTRRASKYALIWDVKKESESLQNEEVQQGKEFVEAKKVNENEKFFDVDEIFEIPRTQKLVDEIYKKELFEQKVQRETREKLIREWIAERKETDEKEKRDWKEWHLDEEEEFDDYQIDETYFIKPWSDWDEWFADADNDIRLVHTWIREYGVLNFPRVAIYNWILIGFIIRYSYILLISMFIFIFKICLRFLFKYMVLLELFNVYLFMCFYGLFLFKRNLTRTMYIFWWEMTMRLENFGIFYLFQDLHFFIAWYFFFKAQMFTTLDPVVYERSRVMIIHWEWCQKFLQFWKPESFFFDVENKYFKISFWWSMLNLMFQYFVFELLCNLIEKIRLFLLVRKFDFVWVVASYYILLSFNVIWSKLIKLDTLVYFALWLIFLY